MRASRKCIEVEYQGNLALLALIKGLEKDPLPHETAFLGGKQH